MAEGEFLVLKDVTGHDTVLGSVQEVVDAMETYLETLADDRTVHKLQIVRISNSKFAGLVVNDD
jgi:hypothetical protein